MTDVEPDPPGPSFPVVGVGASAGGLAAVQELLQALPDELPFAVVVVMHLEPSRPSLLPTLLGRATRAPVTEAQDGMALEVGRVYTGPASGVLGVSGDRLEVRPRADAVAPHMPIDHLFRTLARSCRERGVGIVLSGGGTDGSLGLEEIHAEGGITFTQDDSAATGQMPRSAAAASPPDTRGLRPVAVRPPVRGAGGRPGARHAGRDPTRGRSPGAPAVRAGRGGRGRVAEHPAVPRPHGGVPVARARAREPEPAADGPRGAAGRAAAPARGGAARQRPRASGGPADAGRRRRTRREPADRAAAHPAHAAALFPRAVRGGRVAAGAGARRRRARAPARRAALRAAAGRARRHPRVPAVRHRAVRGDERGAQERARGDPVEQRGAPEHERGAPDGQGGDAVRERGAVHGQRGAPAPQRRARRAQRRPHQRVLRREPGDRDGGSRPADPADDAARRAGVQPAAGRSGAPDRRDPAEPGHRGARGADRGGGPHVLGARGRGPRPGRAVARAADPAVRHPGRQGRRGVDRHVRPRRPAGGPAGGAAGLGDPRRVARPGGPRRRGRPDVPGEPGVRRARRGRSGRARGPRGARADRGGGGGGPVDVRVGARSVRLAARRVGSGPWVLLLGGAPE